MFLWWRGADSGAMDPDAPDPNAPDPDDEEPTVRPEDLDFSADRRVVELDDRRYVVATANSEAPSVSSGDGAAADPDGDTHATETTDDRDAPDRRPDRATARDALVEYVETREPRHGFVVVGSFDDRVEGAEAFGDDLSTVFGEFVDWYATNVDAGTPPAEVLGILLLAADVPVRYPGRALERLVAAHGLSADDPIEDLLTAVRADGFQVPPAAAGRNHD